MDEMGEEGTRWDEMSWRGREGYGIAGNGNSSEDRLVSREYVSFCVPVG